MPHVSVQVKLLSTAVTAAFELLHKQSENYHFQTKYYSGVNTFWPAQSNQSVINITNLIQKNFNLQFWFLHLQTKKISDGRIDQFLFRWRWSTIHWGHWYSAIWANSRENLVEKTYFCISMKLAFSKTSPSKGPYNFKHF